MRKNKRFDKEFITAIYNDLKNNHSGLENAVSRADYALGAGISERTMRAITHEINASQDFDGIISTSKALYMCETKDECLAAIGTTFRSAFTLMRKARKMEEKVRNNGQYKFDDKDFRRIVSYYFPREVEKKGEGENVGDDLGAKKGD